MAENGKSPAAGSGNVACDVCLKEIPESVAVSSEGDDYTQYFCGLECYNKWRESEKPSVTGNTGKQQDQE